jgi:D-alanyl-D-alanine carboxypeptidase
LIQTHRFSVDGGGASFFERFLKIFVSVVKIAVFVVYWGTVIRINAWGEGMKKFICFLLTAMICLGLALTAVGADVPSTYSETYVVMDATTGQVLLEKNANQRMYPASITKILTAAIALDRGNLDDEWEMSYKATHSIESGSTHIALTEGEVVSVRTLVYTTLIESANDSANGLAEYVAGDIDDFPAIMNEQAKAVGALNSNFVNAHGLPDDNHYTTAYDMAMITKWAITVDGFREAFGAEEYTVPPDNIRDESRTYGTHNHMLVESAYYYEGTEGGKLGWTEEAQHTLVELVRRGDMELIVVVMKSQTQYLKYQDVIALCDYCFENYDISTFSGSLFERDPIPVVENGEVVANVTLATDDISVNRPSTLAKADITCTVDVPEQYEAGEEISPQAIFTDKSGEQIAVVPLSYTYEEVADEESAAVAAADSSASDDAEDNGSVSIGKILGTILLVIVILLFLAFCVILMIRAYNLRRRRLRSEAAARRRIRRSGDAYRQSVAYREQSARSRQRGRSSPARRNNPKRYQ